MTTFEHPLGIKTAKKPIIAPRNIEINARDINPIAQVYATLPEKPGQHSWGAGLRFPATVTIHECEPEGCEEGIDVDVVMRLTVPVGEIPASCFVCGEGATAETIQTECPGDPNGLFYPTKRQFMRWDEDETLRWLAEYRRITEEYEK